MGFGEKWNWKQFKLTHGLILLRKTSARKKRQMLEFSKCRQWSYFFGVGVCVCIWGRFGSTTLEKEWWRLKGGRKQRELPTDSLLSPRVCTVPEKEKECIRPNSIHGKQLVWAWQQEGGDYSIYFVEAYSFF